MGILSGCDLADANSCYTVLRCAWRAEYFWADEGCMDSSFPVAMPNTKTGSTGICHSKRQQRKNSVTRVLITDGDQRK